MPSCISNYKIIQSHISIEIKYKEKTSFLNLGCTFIKGNPMLLVHFTFLSLRKGCDVICIKFIAVSKKDQRTEKKPGSSKLLCSLHCAAFPLIRKVYVCLLYVYFFYAFCTQCVNFTQAKVSEMLPSSLAIQKLH